MQQSCWIAGRGNLHRACDVVFGNAVEGGLLLIHEKAVLRLIVFHVPIDVHDALGLLEQIAHLPRQSDTAFHRRAVDLGDQRFEHRRSGRHFGHLDSRAVALGDGQQPLAHLLGDLMALQIAGVFRQQIHLDVGHIGSAAHVVVAHQTIEVVGRRRSRVGLDVHHFALLLRFFGQQLRHPLRLFEGGAVGHVDDHLELALVVEGQHLDLDEAGVEQRARGQQQDHNATHEAPSQQRPVQKISHDPAIEPGHEVFPVTDVVHAPRP